MFKWPGVPSPDASEDDIADFIELECWKDGYTSATAVSKAISRPDDCDHTDGVKEHDPILATVEDSFSLLDVRARACNGGYPFALDSKGLTLKLLRPSDIVPKHVIYKYLLLATRLNMRDDKKHANIDGTQVFEFLSRDVLRDYLGDRSNATTFGTASGHKDFPGKVAKLCKDLCEGVSYDNKDEAPSRANDGKLDVVGWIPFADNRVNKMIVFGQCKTGSNWRDSTTQLQPDTFCHKWMRCSPSALPIRSFFVTEAVSSKYWYTLSSDAGVLFDRCRIVDFSDRIQQDVLLKVVKWTEAAANNVDIKR